MLQMVSLIKDSVRLRGSGNCLWIFLLLLDEIEWQDMKSVVKVWNYDNSLFCLLWIADAIGISMSLALPLMNVVQSWNIPSNYPNNRWVGMTKDIDIEISELINDV